MKMWFDLARKGMKGGALLGALLALCATSVFGQSEDPGLIFDEGLEIREPNFNGDTLCPSSTSQIGMLKYWNQAFGSVDYFHSCSNDQYPNMGIPSNLYGYQPIRNEGEAYAVDLQQKTGQKVKTHAAIFWVCKK